MLKLAKRLLYRYGAVKRLSARRLRIVDQLLARRLLANNSQAIRILEVGCATGKDFVRFFEGRPDRRITGLDLRDYGLRQDNFTMVRGDAAQMPFPDGHFDVTVSFGVLEHVAPIEKLSQAIKEIARVSKSYVVVVPSVSTLVEPHVARPIWQLRDHVRKPLYPGTLLYLSDEAWLAFEGFAGARSVHFAHVPLVVTNLAIYKIHSDWTAL